MIVSMTYRKSAMYLSAIFLSYIINLMVFLPSVTFSILPSTEIFPWAILMGIYYLTIIKKYKFDKWMLVFLMYFITQFSISLVFIIIYQEFSLYQFIRSVFAYINPIMALLVVIKYDDLDLKIFEKSLKIVFVFLTLLGLFQWLGITRSFELFLKFLVPRARGTALSEHLFFGRGITLLSSEPSRAAYEYLFLYSIYRFMLLNKKRNKKVIAWDIVVIFFITILIRSVTGIFYLVIWLVVFWGFKKVLVITLCFVIVLLPIGSTYVFQTRWLSALEVAISNFTSEGWYGLFKALLNLSGFRLISMIASFKYSIIHPVGGGIGNWEISSLTAFKQSGFDYRDITFFRNGWFSVRPTSYIFSLFLDTGILGTVMFFIIILVFIHDFVKTKIGHLEYKNSIYIRRSILFFFLYLIGIGAVGNPIPWVFMAYILRKSVVNKNEEGKYENIY